MKAVWKKQMTHFWQWAKWNSSPSALSRRNHSCVCACVFFKALWREQLLQVAAKSLLSVWKCVFIPGLYNKIMHTRNTKKHVDLQTDPAMCFFVRWMLWLLVLADTTSPLDPCPNLSFYPQFFSVWHVPLGSVTVKSVFTCTVRLNGLWIHQWETTWWLTNYCLIQLPAFVTVWHSSKCITESKPPSHGIWIQKLVSLAMCVC